jgi:hypothetical protein
LRLSALHLSRALVLEEVSRRIDADNPVARIGSPS